MLFLLFCAEIELKGICRGSRRQGVLPCEVHRLWTYGCERLTCPPDTTSLGVQRYRNGSTTATKFASGVSSQRSSKDTADRVSVQSNAPTARRRCSAAECFGATEGSSHLGRQRSPEMVTGHLTGPRCEMRTIDRFWPERCEGCVQGTQLSDRRVAALPQHCIPRKAAGMPYNHNYGVPQRCE